MQIIIGSDHAGFELKEEIKKYLANNRIKYKDLGTDSTKSCDYPEIGYKVAKKVASDLQNNKGILICGTGIGMAIIANKVKGIRAALCYNEETAKVARLHNDSNILCLGAREIDKELAKKITKVWLQTEFSNEERHKRRVEEIKKLDK